MDLSAQDQSIVRRLSESKKGGIAVLMRSSIYCVVLAGLFLYLALARHEPLYSIGIFGMFVVYLAIRIYSARRISGIMPRILEQYEARITELEARLRRIEGAKSEQEPGS